MKFTLIQMLNFVVVLFLSILIVSFHITKFFPINIGYIIVFAICCFLFCMYLCIKKKLLTFQNSYFSIFYLVLVVYIFLPFSRGQIVPSGADMSMHSYLASEILIKNIYPQSFDPLISIKNFTNYPIGMPLLMTVISKLLNIPIYRAGLLLVSITLILLALSFVDFLSNDFNEVASIFTFLFILFWSKDILLYVSWGGIPTLLSLAFSIIAVSVQQKIYIYYKTSNFYYLSFIVALIFAAGFYIHTIPPTICLIAIIFHFLVKNFIFKVKDIKAIFVLLYFIIFLIPFFSSFHPPSETTLNFIYDWQSNEEYAHVPKGKALRLLITIPNYIEERIGKYIFYFSLLGLLISINKKGDKDIFFIIFLFISFVLIVNSKYWILPLSPLFYPDRVVTISLIAHAYFISTFITSAYKKYKMYLYRKTYVFSFILFIPYFINSLYQKITTDYFSNLNYVRSQASVTQSDIELLNWIKLNIPNNSVIGNNYGDAGIWIPTISNKKITIYHPTLHELKQFYDLQKVSPDYIFLGSKIVYKGTETYDSSAFVNKKPLVEIGNSRLYKVN